MLKFVYDIGTWEHKNIFHIILFSHQIVIVLLSLSARRSALMCSSYEVIIFPSVMAVSISIWISLTGSAEKIRWEKVIPFWLLKPHIPIPT